MNSILFYGPVLASNGEEYQTKSYPRYKTFERVIRNYISAPDCVRVDCFKRFPNGETRYFGCLKKGRDRQDRR